MTMAAVGVAGALALAALLCVSDAPNAAAALLASRTGSYPAVAAWSVFWPVAGGLLAGAALGLPLSTSTVVTSAMVGAGMSGRRWHVRWAGVARIFLVWVLTVPACGLVAAGAFEVLRRLP
jgi:phosphate/sulfate permease